QFIQGHNLRMWRIPEEEFDSFCLTATVKYSSSRIFWKYFLWYRLGPLVPFCKSVTRQTYVNVLQKYAILSLYKLVFCKQDIFQEDNAPPHCTKISAEVCNIAGILYYLNLHKVLI
ncbi:18103_t:CDS:1, partial [Funneliformis geosporum]